MARSIGLKIHENGEALPKLRPAKKQAEWSNYRHGVRSEDLSRRGCPNTRVKRSQSYKMDNPGHGTQVASCLTTYTRENYTLPRIKLSHLGQLVI